MGPNPSPVNLVNLGNVDLLRMVFRRRIRLWSPICRMTSVRKRYNLQASGICVRDIADILQLKELFAAYNPTAAKIALRPIARYMVKKLQARNEPRKGRGFGFVSLGSEELQQKAVSEMDGKEIEGRQIAVKVAIDSPGKEDIDPEAAGTAPLTENGVVQANDPPATESTA